MKGIFSVFSLFFFIVSCINALPGPPKKRLNPLKKKTKLPSKSSPLASTFRPKKPLNGFGKILLSRDPAIDRTNPDRLMIVFDGECAQRESLDLQHSLNLIHSSAKNPSCFESISGDDFAHKIHSFGGKSVSFLEMNSDEDCFELDDPDQFMGDDIDWDAHCIEIFHHEPVFQPHNYPILRRDDFECQKRDATELWGLDTMDSGPIQDQNYTGPMIDRDNGVDFFVIDSGVLDTHDEFEGAEIIHLMGDGPQSYFDEYSGETWFHSHGTHVAGTMIGKTVGVSPGIRLYDLRVCVFLSNPPQNRRDTGCPFSLMLDAYEMIGDILENDGDNKRRGVVNLSLGGGVWHLSTSLDWYFQRFIDLGGIVVVAAGNSAIDACLFAPAFSPNAITVGAIDALYVPAEWSNYGDCVDIWAPGVNVRSAIADCDSCYANYGGTSMASPHVAGMIGSILWRNPRLTLNEIRSILMNTDSSSTYPIYGGQCVNDCFGFFDDSCQPYLPMMSTIPPYEDNYSPVFGDYPVSRDVSRFCNFVLIIEEDRSNNGKLVDLAYRPVGVCMSARDSWYVQNLQNPLETDPGNGENDPLNEYDEWSYKYQCIDSRTVEIRLYNDGDCSNAFRDTTHTIRNGHWDGHFSYFVNCRVEKSVGRQCNMEMRLYYPPNQEQLSCPVDIGQQGVIENDWRFSEIGRVQGACQFWYWYQDVDLLSVWYSMHCDDPSQDPLVAPYLDPARGEVAWYAKIYIADVSDNAIVNGFNACADDAKYFWYAFIEYECDESDDGFTVTNFCGSGLPDPGPLNECCVQKSGGAKWASRCPSYANQRMCTRGQRDRYCEWVSC